MESPAVILLTLENIFKGKKSTVEGKEEYYLIKKEQFARRIIILNLFIQQHQFHKV